MLKSIIFLLKKYEKPEWGSLGEAGVLSELPSSPDGALVVTDDTAIMREVRTLGFAVIFCTREERYIEGADYIAESPDALDYEYAETAYCRAHGLSFTVLETPRTIVREMNVGDLPALYAIYDDDEIRRFVEPLLAYGEEKKRLESHIRNQYGLCGFGLWAVVEKSGGQLIGRAGISAREIDGESRPELGYLIARAYRRQGYAFEVCAAIKEYAFDRLGVETLSIVTKPGNTASVRTAEKLGFGKPSLSAVKGCEYMIFQCKE